MPTKSPASGPPLFAAFHQGRRIGQGSGPDVQSLLGRLSLDGQVLVIDLESGEQVDLGRLSASGEGGPPPSSGRPGRPRLGVVAREVTLLPKDWDWLSAQPGGASVALRKLVLKARRAEQGSDQLRQAQLACYRFISAIAGDYPGFEEASRALFAAQPEAFEAQTQAWPEDVRTLARAFAGKAFEAAPARPEQA